MPSCCHVVVDVFVPATCRDYVLVMFHRVGFVFMSSQSLCVIVSSQCDHRVVVVSSSCYQRIVALSVASQSSSWRHQRVLLISIGAITNILVVFAIASMSCRCRVFVTISSSCRIRTVVAGMPPSCHRIYHPPRFARCVAFHAALRKVVSVATIASTISVTPS